MASFLTLTCSQHFPPIHEERALSGSLSSLVLLRILEPQLNWKRWSKRWREKARERERVWRWDGGWKVSGEVDRDRAVSGFITRIVTVCSANNYQHRGMAINLAFTDRLSLLLCLIGQGKSVLRSWKLWGLRKCAPASLMKSDERRWGGEYVEGGKSHTYMLNLQFRMSWNSSSVRERAQLGLTVWTDMELKGKQGYGGKKKSKKKRGWIPYFGELMWLVQTRAVFFCSFGASPCWVLSELEKFKPPVLWNHMSSIKSLKANPVQPNLHEQTESKWQFSQISEYQSDWSQNLSGPTCCFCCFLPVSLFLPVSVYIYEAKQTYKAPSANFSKFETFLTLADASCANFCRL